MHRVARNTRETALRNYKGKDFLHMNEKFYLQIQGFLFVRELNSLT